jgi:2-keto-4-pentenoate hydratase/2-oxohepta-3-ene-1,7-dioic acid hydratase in catechol pathway
MRFATFRTHQGQSWGAADGDAIADLGAFVGFADLKSALAAGALSKMAAYMARAPHYALADIEWLPVIPNPEKILCIGLNYHTHLQETARQESAHPTIFARYSNSQTAHGANLLRPRVSFDLDFEGELAVIIGTAGRYISEASAMAHVGGYACYNDGSLRDWQRHTQQFTPGKNFPETGAFGPWMVTPDEVGAVDKLRLQTRVNGQIMQGAFVGQLIFKIPYLINYCSQFTRLEPGDVIVTGTPGGVGFKRQPPFYLKPGDVVEVEIDNVGLLRNGVADESFTEKP